VVEGILRPLEMLLLLGLTGVDEVSQPLLPAVAAGIRD